MPKHQIFGEVKFSPLNFITAKYNLSTANNLTNIIHQNLVTEIKFDKFISTFDFQEDDKAKIHIY